MFPVPTPAGPSGRGHNIQKYMAGQAVQESYDGDLSSCGSSDGNSTSVISGRRRRVSAERIKAVQEHEEPFNSNSDSEGREGGTPPKIARKTTDNPFPPTDSDHGPSKSPYKHFNSLAPDIERVCSRNLTCHSIVF